MFPYQVRLVHRYWNVVNSKEIIYEKIKSEKHIFYFELSSKHNVDILYVTISMWKQHDFETILASNDVMNIQDAIGKGFGSI